MKRFYLDPYFLTALLLGPCVWALLYWLLPRGAGQFDLQLFLLVSAVYPVLEELAFRGFIQSWLFEKPRFAVGVWGISYANLITSGLFAAAHLFNQPPLWAAFVFFPSLVFGYFRDRFDGVLPSIVLHCWYNAGFFLLLK